MKTERIPLDVVAEFQLDQQGKPEYVEADGIKHYKIKLRTTPVDTTKVDTVVYKLHPTYYDPERVVVAEPETQKFEFPEEITSYGDFKIVVTGSGIAGEAFATKKLSDALADGYRDNRNPSVRQAIDEIKQQ